MNAGEYIITDPKFHLTRHEEKKYIGGTRVLPKEGEDGNPDFIRYIPHDEYIPKSQKFVARRKHEELDAIRHRRYSGDV